MKKITLLLSLIVTKASAQNLQLHYDSRYYPTLYFEYWKAQDSGKHLLKPGDFLLKTEADLQGQGNNIGKFYIQASQSLRAWKPKIFLQLQYSGGGGITEPKQYSYYITNTYQAGVEYPFRWKKAYLTAILDYRYVSYTKPTHDPIFTLYWYHGLLHYKLELAGDFSIWTENKKRFFFAEPQLWYNFTKTLSLGSKLNCYYHVNTPANVFQAYPTLAIRAKL